MPDLVLPRHADHRHRRVHPRVEWVLSLLAAVLEALTSPRVADTALAIVMWTLATVLAGITFLLIVLFLSVAMVVIP